MQATNVSLWNRIAASTHRDGFPVMPGLLPGVGHAVTLHRDAVGAFRRAEREQGMFVQVSLGFGQWYLFCFGAGAFDLLRHKSVGVAGARSALDFIVGRSLISLDGPHHRHVRSAMNPSFSVRGLAESDAETIVGETVLHHVRELVRGGEGDVLPRMQAMALDVIFRLVGVGGDGLAAFHAHYRRMLWGLVPLPFEWPGSPRYFALRATRWINDEVRRLIQKARNEPGESLLHALVHARDESGEPLSDDELVANLRLLFLAGHETTATTLTWATLHLAQRPDLVRRLQEEAAAAGSIPPLSLAAAKKLPLCEGVFREAVRLYAPAWFIERRVEEDITYQGRLLPAGTRIAVCPPLWARDPSLYPDPEAFEPDRWVGRAAGPTPIELSSFGGGAHFCLGYHLSWLESVMYIALLAKALGDAGKTLRLATSRKPVVVYFPMPRPSPSSKVAVE
jgi:cytochrome P450 family 117 subfamily A